MVELDLVEGEIALQRGDYHEAIRLLKSVESSPTHWSYAKALRAASLFCLRDPEWQTNVNEVLESQNSREDAVMLARMLVEDDPTEFLNATESAASSEGAPACAVAACDHAMAKS